MSETATYQTTSCVVTNELQAHKVTSQLQAAGFMEQDISLLFPEEVVTSNIEFEENTKAPEGVTIGASTGGAVGGALGWLAALGTIAIPGAGLFLAAGPIFGALSAAAAGAAVGGVAGALVGLGIPEIEAKVYERKLCEGSFLISARCHDEHQAERAVAIFRECKAREISRTGESVAGT